MIIAEGVDVKIGVFDIETLLEMFDLGVYDPDLDQWYEFEISAYRNDMYKIVSFYTGRKFDYWVSFNGIRFDHPVLEFIVEEHQKWAELSNLEICKIISDFAGKTIEDANFGIRPRYNESNFHVKPIDLFLIHHFDNDAKRTSLKWCEFMMNMDVEEMPIHHLSTGMTFYEVETVKSYRRNDVLATLKLLKVTLGEVSVPGLVEEYLGKNKIQDRFDVENETGLKCLNWNDVKIGEEWNKLNYMKAENIKDPRTLLPKKVVYPYGKKFKNYFPKSMDFQTDQLKDFIKYVGNQYVKNEEQEFKITINKTTHTFAKGGIHSGEKHRRLLPPNKFILRDADVN